MLEFEHGEIEFDRRFRVACLQFVIKKLGYDFTAPRHEILLFGVIFDDRQGLFR